MRPILFTRADLPARFARPDGAVYATVRASRVPSDRAVVVTIGDENFTVDIYGARQMLARRGLTRSEWTS